MRSLIQFLAGVAIGVLSVSWALKQTTKTRQCEAEIARLHRYCQSITSTVNHPPDGYRQMVFLREPSETDQEFEDRIGRGGGGPLILMDQSGKRVHDIQLHGTRDPTWSNKITDWLSDLKQRLSGWPPLRR